MSEQNNAEALKNVLKQINEMINSVAVKRNSKDYQGGRAQVDSICKQVLGAPREVVLKASAEETVKQFQTEQGLDVIRCIITSELLVEECRMDRDENSEFSDMDLPVRALHLLTLVYPASRQMPGLESRVRPLIEMVDSWLKDYQLGDEVGIDLFRSYGRSGFFAKAEDWFYRVENNDQYKPELAGFYKFLLEQVPDEALEAGGLPREEIEESIQEFIQPA